MNITLHISTSFVFGLLFTCLLIAKLGFNKQFSWFWIALAGGLWMIS